ncbi:MAG: cytochrome P450 [Anaerolineae bacterium]|nr:cytochrome P450 [Anaerolineae bacterium]
MSQAKPFNVCLTGPEFFRNPYPVYHALRAEAPIYWDETLQQWIITRYQDVAAILSDQRHFAPNRAGVALFAPLFAEKPNLARLRHLVKKAMATHSLQVVRPRIEEIVNQLLANIPANTPIDFINDFAFPLPALVLAELMGVVSSEARRLTAWSHDIAMAVGANVDAGLFRQGQVSLEAMLAYLQQLVNQRRQQPTTDLISRLLAVEDRGDKLSEYDVAVHCIFLFLAGHETTQNLIGNGMLALLRHPEQLQLLRNDSTLINAAVEEMLRYDTPVQMMRRVTLDNVVIDGVAIKKGRGLMVFIGAANRDPAIFQNPDCFDLSRPENPHLAFGAGLHFCSGGALARQEAQVAFQTILEHTCNLKLVADTLTWQTDSHTIRGLKTLPMELC